MLLSGVLRPRLINNPFASYSFINLDFLLPYTAHFDDNIVLPFFVFNTFQSTFSVFFCTLDNMSTCFIMTKTNIMSILIAIKTSSFFSNHFACIKITCVIFTMKTISFDFLSLFYTLNNEFACFILTVIYFFNNIL